MSMIMLTNAQVRRFLLLKHGLLGDYRFIGKQGAYDYVRQTGCIQFDPVDACGRNAELTLASRVEGFTKQTLAALLYADRALVDYPDKNLSILPAEDWPYFERYRQAARDSGLRFEGLTDLEAEAKAYIREHGAVCSDDLPIDGSIRWHSAIHWSGEWGGNTNAARAVLEQLYSTGELIIHHKNGTRKYYDLAEKYLSPALLSAADPLPDTFEHQIWRVYRRIGAVGLLWNRPSDAWLNIWGLKTPQRTDAFTALLAEKKILEIHVESLKHPLFCHADDLPLIETVLHTDHFKPRCELIAPLDCMLWDRKLIHALFGFDYTWEIYTPASKRKYGFYVLPILFGDRFIGRVEAIADAKSGVLTVRNVWYEEGVKRTKKLQDAVERRLRRLAQFNGCDRLIVSAPTPQSLLSAH
ncbi:MAG: crosslink repair DNA glycosylase YcaQ family protein [Clostridiaceae bacterium]|nr:crosslink repair DNA glycosylase YcaQ family protein [Clostridiaceae bacterium]